jgi:hypothetical protein
MGARLMKEEELKGTNTLMILQAVQVVALIFVPFCTATIWEDYLAFFASGFSYGVFQVSGAVHIRTLLDPSCVG